MTVELSGDIVRLGPLSHDHAAGPLRATEDGGLWKLWYTSVPMPDGMAAEIDRRLALQDVGTMIPFATCDLCSGKVIGMTGYMNIDAALPRIEIGSTWNAKSAQGSGTNPGSTLLLLTDAFEVWDCAAVEFRTSWHNRQSRAAIEKLGAKLDGVLRQHTRTSDGSLRDTRVYSVVQTEWPQVRASLLFRLGGEV